MKELQDTYSMAKTLGESLNLEKINSEIQNLTKFKNIQPQINNQNLQQINSILDRLMELISGVNISKLTQQQEDIAEKLGLLKLLGKSAKLTLQIQKSQINRNRESNIIIEKIINDYSELILRISQTLYLFKPFNFEIITNNLTEENAIIEIIFQNGVSIDDFKDAKDQMNDWFFIIGGYSRLLNSTREDFEIIGISKNSPAKFKVKTTLKNASVIIGILTSILLIQKQFLENQIMIEQLKQNTLVPNSDFQKQFIEESEKHLNEKIEEKINEIVEDKFKKYNKDGDGDVKVNLKKAVNNQYTFIANGGDVNIYSLNGEVNNNIKILEKTKEEIKQISEAYQNQKAITSGQEGQETEESE